MTPLGATPHAPEVLAQAADLLDGLGLRWWLSAGTALGIHRDGALIPHDTDLDIGVLGGEELHPAVEAAFFGVGGSELRFMPWQRAFTVRGVIVDIYIFRRDGDLLVCDTECGRMSKPARLFDQFEMVEFSGRRYPMPSPAEDYLQVRYGPNWRIPRAEKRPWAEDAANLT